jgi:hypothetical protein
MEKKVNVGDCVTYVDENRVWFSALVTAVWGEITHGNLADGTKVVNYPCINLVTISSDESRTDQYGRQIDRSTSIPYLKNQTAPGFCWFFNDEADEARQQFQNVKSLKI